MAIVSVFNWNLFWVIEYPDILKFGLIAIAVVSSFLFSSVSLIDHVLVFKRSTGRSKWIFFGAVILISLLILVAALHNEAKQAEPAYIKIFFYAMCALLIVFWTWFISHFISI